MWMMQCWCRVDIRQCNTISYYKCRHLIHTGFEHNTLHILHYMCYKLRNNTEQQPPSFPGQLAGHHSLHQTWTDSVDQYRYKDWLLQSPSETGDSFPAPRPCIKWNIWGSTSINTLHVKCVSMGIYHHLTFMPSCQYTNDQCWRSSWPGWAWVSPTISFAFTVHFNPTLQNSVHKRQYTCKHFHGLHILWRSLILAPNLTPCQQLSTYVHI